ncbi:branched-chain amino acid ABC transporter permease [Paradesulfitobacterium aromaticivorans]
MAAIKQNFKWSWFFYLAMLFLALIFPFLSPNSYYIQVVSMGFIFAIAVYGLNLIEGYMGQLSLAQSGLFGVGAYAAALLTMKGNMSFWIAVPLASLLTAAFAFVVGLISFRTRGHYFVVLTLCIGVIINLIIQKWDSVTGGMGGLIGIPKPSPLGSIEFNTIKAQYYLILSFLLFTVFVMYRLIHSLVGQTFISIRNSEELAATIGINVMKNKLLAFCIAAFFTGMAGSLYASFIRFIGPDISSPTLTFEFLLYLLAGGQGTIAGPIVGTLLMSGLTESLQFLKEYRLLLYGPLLILIVKFFPLGLVGFVKVSISRIFQNSPQQDSDKGIKQGLPAKGEGL